MARSKYRSAEWYDAKWVRIEREAAAIEAGKPLPRCGRVRPCKGKNSPARVHPITDERELYGATILPVRIVTES